MPASGPAAVAAAGSGGSAGGADVPADVPAADCAAADSTAESTAEVAREPPLRRTGEGWRGWAWPGLPTADHLAAARLRLGIDGPVATVTLSCPERRNAQLPDTWLALAQIGARLPGQVRVVVVRGEGSSFCAGLDLTELEAVSGLASLPPQEAADEIARYQAGFTWLRRPDLVSIAAVRGHAVGAGFQLALACDLRILADDALLCMAETSRGLVPDLTGTSHLVELVGHARALEICLTSRRVGAEEALRLRLAELVVPGADLDAAVADLVAAVLAAPPAATVETKALLASAGRLSFDEQLGREREAQVRRLRDLADLGE